jgi:NAD(P)H-dependent flavin oxidoreductase YrpB (nitropropane dioxygenase family)
MAGQSVGLVTTEEPTEDIIDHLIEEAVEALDMLAAPTSSLRTQPM